MFGVNLLLAIAWLALTGEYSFVNLSVGFGLGYLMMWLTSAAMPNTSPLPGYIRKSRKIVSLVLYFVWTILLANWRMIGVVLTGERTLSPAIVAIPLELESPYAITMLANWITLTPGTLTLDVSEDLSHIYVHTIQCDDVAAFRAEIKTSFEKRLLEVFA